jgi:hypothetical protein
MTAGWNRNFRVLERGSRLYGGARIPRTWLAVVSGAAFGVVVLVVLLVAATKGCS